MPPGISTPTFPGFPVTFDKDHGLGRPGLDPAQVQIERNFLETIQGNILKGHGRDHLRLIFFRFTQIERIPDFLTAAARRVTSAAEQEEQVEKHHMAWPAKLKLAKEHSLLPAEREELQREATEDDTRLFCGLMLSRAGLGLTGSLPPDESGAFGKGMRERMTRVLAPDEMKSVPYSYEGTSDDFHGVFLLASNNPTDLDDQVNRLLCWCHDYGVYELSETEGERGFAWRDTSNPYGTGYPPPREPFGFADGISQPVFFHNQRRTDPMRDNCPRAHVWTNLRLKDVFIEEGPHAGGTFAALIKIEQKVNRFRAHERDVADLLRQRHGLPWDMAKYLAPALLMGRTRQGYPVGEILGSLASNEANLRALFPDGPHPQAGHPPQPPPWLNEFDFKAHSPAAAATKTGCPFHVHIRKMNPRRVDRDHLNDEDDIIFAQPIRRGAAYGSEAQLRACEEAEQRHREGDPPVAWPDSGAGLLFLAYMRNLEAQFETLHTGWAPDSTFPIKKPRSGQDPVLTPDATGLQFGGVPLPPIPPVLHRLGGVYLYAPSIPWLQRGGQ